MIVPMKKVSLVVLNKEKKDALSQLRKLGVVHLEQIEGKGQNLQDLKDTYATLENSVSLLSEVKLDKKQKKALKDETLTKEGAVEKAKELLDLQSKISESEEKISFLENEILRIKAFGSFNPEDIKALQDSGIYLLLAECSKEYYKTFPENIDKIYLNADKSKVYFVIVCYDDGIPESVTSEISILPLSEKSISQMQNEIGLEKQEIQRLNAEIAANVSYTKAIQHAMKLYEKDIEFENAYSGMETDIEGTESATNLAWISGYVPIDEMKKVVEAAKENHWAYMAEDPENPEEVPTKLKNNKFVSLIYPLTDFLGTVPGYSEYDISGWFLFFFTIFFGMIFGDGGYGLLITIFALIMVIKGAVNKKPSAFMNLCLLLGVATVVWGWVTCTWFGLTPEQLRSIGLGFLPDSSVKVLSNAYATLPDGSERLWYLPWSQAGLTTDQNLQIFCFILALMQLSVAHIKGMGRYIKSPKFFGELGSLLQLWGMFYVVLAMVVNGEVFALGLVVATINGFELKMLHIVLALIGVGFVLSFIFSNYEGSVGKAVLESCKNIISVLLGVVNVFSDIVSYIRLWAVGLAGAAISNTVNEMAGPLLGHFYLFLAFVVLIAFGHGLNMILNLLSVIVHGVRLNTLEFSSHLGMSWSGFKYAPFSEKEVK